MSAVAARLRGDAACRFIGVLVHHAHAGLPLEDDTLFPLYDAAGDAGVPVLLWTGSTKDHDAAIQGLPVARKTGGRPPANSLLALDASTLDRVVERFPHTQFVLLNCGFDYVHASMEKADVCLALAKHHANVWLSPCGLGAADTDPSGQVLAAFYERAKAAGVVQRLVYGALAFGCHGCAPGCWRSSLTPRGNVCALCCWLHRQCRGQASALWRAGRLQAAHASCHGSCSLQVRVCVCVCVPL